MSRAENVNVFLNIKDKLINLGYSDNGIDINEDLPEVKSILKLKLDETSLETIMRYLGLYGSEVQFNDYLNVVKEYQALKDSENAIDFSDMQTIVWHYLQNDQFTYDRWQKARDFSHGMNANDGKIAIRGGENYGPYC